MKAVIKQFIEENKNYIEQENWRGLFLSWYLHWAPANNRHSDQILLEELYYVLSVVSPTFYEDTESIRAEIIVDKICDYFYMNMNSRVSLAGAVNYLNSLLGFNIVSIKDLFKRAAAEVGIDFTNI